jgi:DNA-binding response OmpR family regulator
MDETPKILIVEDDETLLETLVYNLQRQGYEVISANHGRAGLKLALAEIPDLIILDVMLPGLDGIEICRIVRQVHDMPIIMLTARTDEVDKIVGLEMGADDYLTKPFSMRELVARIKVQLRRMRMMQKTVSSAEDEASILLPAIMQFDNLAVDIDRREVRIDDKPVTMKPREYDLLLFLTRNKGIAVSRDLILDRVWGWESVGTSSRTVDVHVRWLREKIEPDPNRAQRIVTVRGIGYRFDG